MSDLVAEVFEDYRSWHAVRLVMLCLARNVRDACCAYANEELRKQGKGTRR